MHNKCDPLNCVRLHISSIL